MAEPTREQMARDYANALRIIDDLRTSNAGLLAMLKEADCMIRALRGGLNALHEHRFDDSATGAGRSIATAIAKAEGR